MKPSLSKLVLSQGWDFKGMHCLAQADLRGKSQNQDFDLTCFFGYLRPGHTVGLFKKI
jgi:hypothetical protein